MSQKLALYQPKTPMGTRSLAYPAPLSVAVGNHWLLVGATGTGKTTAMRRLIAAICSLWPGLPVNLLDLKMTGDFDHWPGVVQSDEAPTLQEVGFQVWQPIIEAEAQIERYLRSIEAAAPRICAIDELQYLCYRGGRFSEGYRRLLKLGRALPVGTFTGTQELAGIPRQAIGQCTWILRFRLQNQYDQVVADRLANNREGEPADEHGFYFNRVGSLNQAWYYRSIYELLQG